MYKFHSNRDFVIKKSFADAGVQTHNPLTQVILPCSKGFSCLQSLTLSQLVAGTREKLYQGDNGVMDKALACCPGSPGSTPAVVKSKVAIFRCVFLPLGIRW